MVGVAWWLFHHVWVCLRWPYPRTPWSVRGAWQWAGQSMAAAASSSSWAGWACCLVYRGSSPAAAALWSLDTGCASSPWSPSWWRLRRARASARQRKHQRPHQCHRPTATGPLGPGQLIASNMLTKAPPLISFHSTSPGVKSRHGNGASFFILKINIRDND